MMSRQLVGWCDGLLGSCENEVQGENLRLNRFLESVEDDCESGESADELR